MVGYFVSVWNKCQDSRLREEVSLQTKLQLMERCEITTGQQNYTESDKKISDIPTGNKTVIQLEPGHLPNSNMYLINESICVLKPSGGSWPLTLHPLTVTARMCSLAEL
jgi:hypothetical protein